MSDEIKKSERKVRQVTQGRVANKTIGQKAADIFVKQDLESVIDYVVKDRLIPGLINAAVDLFETTIEMIFLDGARPRSRYGSGSYGNKPKSDRPSYTSYYKSEVSTNEKASYNSYGRYPVKRIIVDSGETPLENKEKIKEVFTDLADQLEEDGYFSVGDLYDSVGIRGEDFTDRNWGWRSMRGFGSRPLRDGSFEIVIPKPEPV